jgi:glutamyl-tRNA synthetase
LWDASLEGERRAWFEQVLEILKARSRKLADLARDCAIFLGEEIEFAPEAVAKHLQDPETTQRMKDLRSALAEVQPFDETSTEQSLRKVAERMGIAAAKLIHPLRVALTGQAVSPGVFAVLVLVGRDRALRRIDRLIRYLEERAAQPS